MMLTPDERYNEPMPMHVMGTLIPGKFELNLSVTCCDIALIKALVVLVSCHKRLATPLEVLQLNS